MRTDLVGWQTEQTRDRICVTQPLVVYETAQCSLVLPTNTLVRTRYVQFTYFIGRVLSTPQSLYDCVYIHVLQLQIHVQEVLFQFIWEWIKWTRLFNIRVNWLFQNSVPRARCTCCFWKTLFGWILYTNHLLKLHELNMYGLMNT